MAKAARFPVVLTAPLGAGVVVGLFVWRFCGGVFALWGKTWTPVEGGGRVPVEAALAGGVAACWLLWEMASRYLRDFRGVEIRAARRRMAWAFAPLAVLLLPLLGDAMGFGYSYLALDLFGVAAGATVWLLIAPFAATANPEWPGRKDASRAVAAGTVIFFVVFGALALLKFYALHFGYRDSGLYSEAVMNTLRGRFLHTNYYGGCYLGDHVSPILVAFCPIMALFPSAGTMLLVQAAALALGAPAVYRIARRALDSRLAGLLLAFGYLLNPVTDHLNFAHVWGFHVVTLAVPLLLWALDALLDGKDVRFFVLLFLALCCKEDVGVATFVLWPFIFFSLKRRKLALIVAVVGLAWAVVALKVVSPMFWGADYRYVSLRWGHLGKSTPEVLLNAPVEFLRVLPKTNRLAFLLHLVAPLAFAPLGAFWALLAFLPQAALLMISQTERFYSIMCQTTATLLPALFLAAVWAIKIQADRLGRRPEAWGGRWLAWAACGKVNRRVVGQALAAAVFACCLVFHVLLAPSPFSAAGKDVFSWDAVIPKPRLQGLWRLAKQIPPDASVAATDKIALHFIHQPNVYVADYKKLGTPEEAELDKADRVLLDLGLSEDIRHAYAIRDRLLKKRTHGLVASDEAFALFKKGAHTLRRKPVPDPEALAAAMPYHPVSPPDSPLQCLGMDIKPYGRGLYRVTSLWRVTEPIPDPVLPMLALRRADGREDILKPFYLFDGAFPVYLWRPGDVYLDETVADLAFRPDPKTTRVFTQPVIRESAQRRPTRAAPRGQAEETP